MGLIASYNLRSMTVRKGTAAMTAMGIAMVVAVFVMTMAIAQGFNGALVASGSNENAILLRKGATSETVSGVLRTQLPLIQAMPQVARASDGHPMASPELVVIISLPLQGWTLAAAARKLHVALPRSERGPRRVELDLPGQLEQELVGYPVRSKSLFFRRGLIPSWSKPTLVIRNEQILTPAEAERSDMQSVLLRALGAHAEIEVDSEEHTLFGSDVLLLCSDGLTRMVTEPEIAGTLQAEPDPTKAAERLVELANEQGGADNVTAIVVRIGEEPKGLFSWLRRGPRKNTAKNGSAGGK